MNFETYATWNLQHTLDEERKDEETDDSFACSCGVDYLPMPVGPFIVRNAAEEYTRSSETQPPDVRYLRKFSRHFGEGRGEIFLEGRVSFLAGS